MYCENCGRKLDEGEICPCKKKLRKKIHINGITVIGLVMTVIGIGFISSWQMELDLLLDLIPVTAVAELKEVLMNAVPILFFIAGMLSGIAALKSGSMKKLSVIVIAINLFGTVISGTLTVWNGYQYYTVIHVCSNELTDENAHKLRVIYGGLDTGSALKDKIENLLRERLESAKEDYGSGQISYTDAEKEISDIECLYIDELADEVDKCKKDLKQMRGAQRNDGGMSETSEDRIAIAQAGEQTAATEKEVVHTYDYFVADISWEDAYRSCKEKGGHLVTIESQEELDYLLQDLESKNMQNYLFYLGGRRDLDSENYYWVDADNCVTGNVLNSSDAWNIDCWLDGEPSFKDDTLGVTEHVINMFYYKDAGRWVWNDVPNNLLGSTSVYRGRIGYICEYENET